MVEEPLLPDDEQAILAAARAVLERDGLTTAATGDLLRFALLADSLDADVFEIERWEVAIDSAAVVHADAMSAVVEVDGQLTGAATFLPDIGHTWETPLAARILLAREPGGWKAVDVALGGSSVLESFFDLDQSASAGDLTVRTLGGRIAAPNVHLFLEFENGSGAPVAVRAASIAVPRRMLGWRWRPAGLATSEVEPGPSRIGAAGAMEPLDVSGGVRLLLDTDAGLVDLKPPSAASRRRMPWIVTRPLLNWVAVTLGQALGVGLAVAVVVSLFFRGPGWAGGLISASTFVVVCAANLLWGLIRKRHAFPGSQVPGYLVGGALLVAAIAALVVSTDGSVDDVVDAVDFLFTSGDGLGVLLFGVALIFIDHCPRELRERRHGKRAWQTGAVIVGGVGAAVALGWSP